MKSPGWLVKLERALAPLVALVVFVFAAVFFLVGVFAVTRDEIGVAIICFVGAYCCGYFGWRCRQKGKIPQREKVAATDTADAAPTLSAATAAEVAESVPTIDKDKCILPKCSQKRYPGKPLCPECWADWLGQKPLCCVRCGGKSVKPLCKSSCYPKWREWLKS